MMNFFWYADKYRSDLQVDIIIMPKVTKISGLHIFAKSPDKRGR